MSNDVICLHGQNVIYICQHGLKAKHCRSINFKGGLIFTGRYYNYVDGHCIVVHIFYDEIL